MSTTKSIRLDKHDLQQVERVFALMPAATEAGLLKHLLLLGLFVQKKDIAVQLYTRDGYSTGEIAEMLDMSRLEVLHTLSERKVHVLDIELNEFAQDLAKEDL